MISTSRWIGKIAAAVMALGTMPVQFRAVPASEPSTATDVQSPLPPRALVRIGSDESRIRSLFISHIAFSPDGRLVAVAEGDTTVPRVSLFDVRTSRFVKVISPPDRTGGSVRCVAFSPDQTKLAWGEGRGHVALWNLAHDRLLFRERFHGRGVSDVAFSPDGQILASVGEEGTFHLRRDRDPRDVVLDVATGERNPVPRDNTGDPGGLALAHPLRLAFTPDGASLVVGSASIAAISVWRIKDCGLVRRIENAYGNSKEMAPTLNFISVTPDGRRIVSGWQSTAPNTQPGPLLAPRELTFTEVRLWDLETGQRIKDVQHREELGRGSAALSRDGRLMAVGEFGMLRILDAATRRPEQTVPLPGRRADQPAFSPDGTLVATSIDNALGIFEVRTGRRLHHHDERTLGGYLGPAAWSPAGDRIVTGSFDGEVRLWDAATGKLVWHKLMAPVIGDHDQGGVVFVAFTGDGRRLVVAGRQHDPFEFRGGILATYDAATGSLERKADQKLIRQAALAPDGRMIVVSNSARNARDKQLVGVEVGSGKTRWTSPKNEEDGFGQIAGMRFERGSSFLEVAMSDGNVIRFNGLTGREQHRFLADGRTAEQLQEERRLNRDLKSRNQLFYIAAFSDDGRTMVSYENEWICVWDVPAGSLRRRIRNPHAQLCLLTLSSDGNTIATVDVLQTGKLSEDEIRLYDTQKGDLVLTLNPGEDRAYVLAFSPDDTKLFTGFHRGTAIVWDVRRAQAASRAKD